MLIEKIHQLLGTGSTEPKKDSRTVDRKKNARSVLENSGRKRELVSYFSTLEQLNVNERSDIRRPNTLEKVLSGKGDYLSYTSAAKDLSRHDILEKEALSSIETYYSLGRYGREFSGEFGDELDIERYEVEDWLEEHEN